VISFLEINAAPGLKPISLDAGSGIKKIPDRETKNTRARFRNSHARLRFFLINLKVFNYLRAEYDPPEDGRKSKISGSIQKSGRPFREQPLAELSSGKLGG